MYVFACINTSSFSSIIQLVPANVFISPHMHMVCASLSHKQG